MISLSAEQKSDLRKKIARNMRYVVPKRRVNKETVLAIIKRLKEDGLAPRRRFVTCYEMTVDTMENTAHGIFTTRAKALCLCQETKARADIHELCPEKSHEAYLP